MPAMLTVASDIEPDSPHIIYRLLSTGTIGVESTEKVSPGHSESIYGAPGTLPPAVIRFNSCCMSWFKAATEIYPITVGAFGHCTRRAKL